MFGNTETVVHDLEDLIEKLINDEIRVVNVGTEGGIWVNGECVQFTVSMSFVSNGHVEPDEENNNGKEEISKDLNRAVEEAERGGQTANNDIETASVQASE